MKRDQGLLFKNPNGRWQIDGHEFTSGCRMELFIDAQWIKGRIEYDHSLKAYIFLAGTDEVPMLLRRGLIVRHP